MYNLGFPSDRLFVGTYLTYGWSRPRFHAAERPTVGRPAPANKKA